MWEKGRPGKDLGNKEERRKGQEEMVCVLAENCLSSLSCLPVSSDRVGDSGIGNMHVGFCVGL